MNKKILLIEDTLEVRENTAEILELSGYEVFTAENGKEGGVLAREAEPDIIICDIMMPKLDGYGVIHMLSRDPKTSAIPFIFLTAKADKTDIRKGMGLGADDYLTKPFEETDLLECIENRLKKHQNIKNSISDLQGFELKSGPKKDAEEKVATLIENKKVRAFDKKEYLYKEGDYVKFLYYLESGKVKCTRTDDYGKQLITQVYQAGDYIGHVDILKDDLYQDTATFIESGSIVYIPKEDFVKLVHNDKDLASHFIKKLSQNIAQKETELLRLAFSPVRERTANALVRLYLESNSTEEILNSLSREELAAIVGTSTESLIRMLSEFKKEGLISIQEKIISIDNLQTLKKLALV